MILVRMGGQYLEVRERRLDITTSWALVMNLIHATPTNTEYGWRNAKLDDKSDQGAIELDERHSN